MLLRLKVAWREFVHEVENPTQRLVFAGFTFALGLIRIPVSQAIFLTTPIMKPIIYKSLVPVRRN